MEMELLIDWLIGNNWLSLSEIYADAILLKVA